MSNLSLKQKSQKKISNDKWIKNNPEKRKASALSYYYRNREKSLKYAKEWQKRNPDKVKATSKRWNISNPEKAKQRRDNWNKNNPEKRFGFRLKQYGVTPNEYNLLLVAQNSVCAICFHKEEKRRLSVDHDHTTGKVRGLLCQNCNMAIGLMKDSQETIMSAFNYLTKHQL